MSVLTVTNTNSKGAGSLTYELLHAKSGDTIVFSAGIKGDTIALPSTLEIQNISNLTIDGGSDDITLSGASGGGHTVLDVAFTASVTIDNLTIANGVGTAGSSGAASAGGIYDSGSLTLNSDAFVDDSATGAAGANGAHAGQGGGGGGAAAGGIYVASGAMADVNTTVTFQGDTAQGGQGGYGAGGTYYAGGQAYASGPGAGKFAHKGAGSGGAGGYSASRYFNPSAPPDAKSYGYQSGAHGKAGAGKYGAAGGGKSGEAGLSHTYSYDGSTAQAAGGGGAGGAAYADFGGAGTIVCYLRGTLILGEQGSVRVEEVKIGDGVVTGSGEVAKVKWIGRSRYAGWAVENNEDIQPIQFKVGSIADSVPNRDLFVSPEHAMFIDGVLIPARNLINGVSVVRAAPMEEVSYFHLELDRHAVIFAEGALAETFVDDDSRDLFQNAAEFTEMYPDAGISLVAEYCAPRVEDGYKLDSVRRLLMSRAVRLRSNGTAAEAPVMTGNVDVVSRTVVEGWAYLPHSPETPVSLAILDNGAVIGRVTADGYRPDLEKAGIGNGRHGFRFRVPSKFSETIRHEIEVRRESDWALVAGSSGVLTAEVLEILPAYTGISNTPVHLA